MKALRFHSFGTPDVLVVEEIAQPEPAAGEVLIQVHGAGINPSDIVNVAGRFKATTLPRVPGRDFAGVVVTAGVSNGQRIWGSVPDFGVKHDGSHAGYVVLPERSLSAVPSNLSLEQAAAVGVPYTTAWGALIRSAELRAGETVVITGSAGAVGQAATQIANWIGARVIGATRGASPAPGTSAVIDTEGDMRKQVFDLTEGHGAEVMFDTIGGPLFEPALRCLRPGGRQVAISSSKEPHVIFSLVDFYHNLSRLIGFDSYSYTLDDTVAVLNELRPGFESGALTPPFITAVPLDRAVDAYKSVAGGHTGSKFVLTN